MRGLLFHVTSDRIKQVHHYDSKDFLTITVQYIVLEHLPSFLAAATVISTFRKAMIRRKFEVKRNGK